MILRPTAVRIDVDAFQHNLEYFRAKTDKTMMIVVKADAYGHGDVILSRYANEWGYSHFAVSSLEEGIHLRRAGIRGMILVLGPVQPHNAGYAKEYDISLTVPSLEFVRSLGSDAQGLKVHLKADTGMNRIGLRTIEELNEAIPLLEEKGAVIEGIFSHYAKADEPDSDFTDVQFSRFREMVRATGYPFDWIHIDNSDGILRQKESFTNMARLGIGAYGYAAYDEDRLKPVLSWETKIAMTKMVHAGDMVGYGGQYVAEKDEWISTIPVGYADGLLRRNTGRRVWVGGTYAQLVGRICMDQCMIRTERRFPEGTPVEIIGPHVPLTQMCADLDTIPNEILTTITSRVPRVYYRRGKEAGVDPRRFPEAL